MAINKNATGNKEAMMKTAAIRFGTMVLLLLMIVASAVGCGDSDTTTSSTSASTSTTLETTTTTSPDADTESVKPSPSKQAYAAGIMDVASDLLSVISDSFLLIDTFPQWTEGDKATFAKALTVMRTMKSDVDKLSPPPSGWEDVHRNLEQAADHFYDAANLATEGVDSQDSAALNEARELMTKGGSAIREATAAMPK